MTPDMDTWIADRYPSAFPTGHVAPECGPGWTALIEAAAIVVAGRGNATSTAIPIIGIKEKYGSLRISYGGADAWIDGALDFVDEMSQRVCEVTGDIGAMMVRGWWWRTVSRTVAERDGYSPPPGHSAEADLWRRPSIAEVADPERRGPCMMACRRVLVPPGWAVLVDVLLAVLSRTSIIIRIEEIRHLDGLLHVLARDRDAESNGSIAAAVALSRRIDPMTGAAAMEWT